MVNENKDFSASWGSGTPITDPSQLRQGPGEKEVSVPVLPRGSNLGCYDGITLWFPPFGGAVIST